MKTMKAALALLFLVTAWPVAASNVNSGANRHFVEAASLVRKADEFGLRLSIDDRLALLEESLARFEALLEQYPESELAVALVSGRSVGKLSFDYVEKRIGQLRREQCTSSPDPACILKMAIDEIKGVTNGEEHARLLDELSTAARRVVYGSAPLFSYNGTDFLEIGQPPARTPYRWLMSSSFLAPGCVTDGQMSFCVSPVPATVSSADTDSVDDTDVNEWLELVEAGRIADAIAQARSKSNGIAVVLDIVQGTPDLDAWYFQVAEALSESMRIEDRVLRAEMLIALAEVSAESRDRDSDVEEVKKLSASSDAFPNLLRYSMGYTPPPWMKLMYTWTSTAVSAI